LAVLVTTIPAECCPSQVPVATFKEAAGTLHWILQLLEELEIEYRVGHPAHT
jgi:hypothetical protein